MTGRLNLARCDIVVAADRPGWVDQAVSDLAEWTGGQERDRLADAKSRVVVLVGKQTVRSAAETDAALSGIGLEGLSDQGFLLQTVRGAKRNYVICSGGGSKGDAYAVIELVKALDRTAKGMWLGETDRREEPFFVRRGMYAHQHWAYNFPYALRTWGFEEWKSYVDLLAYLKINFFSIWSMVGMLPNPLSEADRAYLENYRRVIDYARNRRGMEVFIGECANNVAESPLTPTLSPGGRGGMLPISERDYFDVEVLKNPADPREFEQIMLSRRNLYEIAGNADGYWIIDSDPGGCPGSPTSEFVDILIGNRKLIDELADKGKDAKLAYWMWCGWGNDDRETNARRAVEGMRDRLQEPWVLFPCWGTHLDIVRDLGYTDKSIFFPYSTIEDEPAPPMTRLRFDEMHFHLNNAISMWGIRSAMGNAQTPLAQIPNIYYFAETAWHGVQPSHPADEDVVRPLARLISPDLADTLAKGWLALHERDRIRLLDAMIDVARAALSGAKRGAGPLGQFYFPGLTRLLIGLGTQLKQHKAANDLCEALESHASDARVGHELLTYYEAMLAWQSMHGFRQVYNYGPDVNRIRELWAAYTAKKRFPPERLEKIRKRLLGKGYDEASVDAFLELTSLPSQEVAR